MVPLSTQQEGGSVRKPASPTGRYLIYVVGEIALAVIGIPACP